MSPRTGRPPSGNASKEKVETRMSKDELAKLDYCCKMTGKSRSEIIREGIDEMYLRLCDLKEK